MAVAAAETLRSGLVLDVKRRSSQCDVRLTDCTRRVTEELGAMQDGAASGFPSQVFQIFTQTSPPLRPSLTLSPLTGPPGPLPCFISSYSFIHV